MSIITRISPFALRRSVWAAARGSVLPRARGLLTLAIETSCDDTSVAIVEKKEGYAKIHFHEKVTCDSTAYKGIHPVVALESHQENLAKLVNKALTSLPPAPSADTPLHKLVTLANGNETRRKPDIVCATRGPGMRTNVLVGLDTGKALSVAWQVPFIGVHHMQAHLVTPHLQYFLDQNPENDPEHARSHHDGGVPQQQAKPAFPFISILASGGHTMLVKSTSLTNHEILASTLDIAVGSALDKAARLILPDSVIETSQHSVYAKALEQYAFPNGCADHADYRAPATRRDEVQAPEPNEWGWSFTTPFANTRDLVFSFTSIEPTVERLIKRKEEAGEGWADGERVALARAAMRTSFEHIASRLIIALEDKPHETPIQSLVISGGVAANQFLKTVLRAFLDVRGFQNIQIYAPPPYLCTDNAAMIAWAGMEMYEAGWRTDLSVHALRKWSLADDSNAKDGGFWGPGGWIKEEGKE
ncbi:hypothetical protein ASPACDRAFT_119429 [Aspergillus aculeatus ATCC 16872]|uniref:N(6)-L-threonylcarbamoyladenine synthase n=1 Tax=Aspergillus aculeatus (strain ATCC 16872 / CBS 172.66 / WB 5094) TaxID=690307 RepID=A0A1L9WV23_ASPA1|nr:uncharacterized protein ASPACDRAFT_119429 [Aspergillus aculeatus ATCC 16872]OJJ99737.1 hypothetical protein ASPACDRAFT_119429 [Aspergillus aculeatus ATCC 16872]